MATLGAMFGAAVAETFMGLPRCRELGRLSARMALIGADGCTPYPSVGFYCAGGPAAIRADYQLGAQQRVSPKCRGTRSARGRFATPSASSV